MATSEQAEQEGQVIVAGEDVLDAEHEVVAQVVEERDRAIEAQRARGAAEDVLPLGLPGELDARQALVHRVEVEEEVVLDGDVGGGALAVVVDASDGEEAVGLVGERERARRRAGRRRRRC